MEESIDEIIERAIVDAYTIDEQLWGFNAILSDEITLPLKIQVLGKNYMATELVEDCDRLKWVLYLNENQKYQIDITDTTIVDNTSHSFRLVQAYRKWLSC